MDLFMEINTEINNFVWGPIMLTLLVGTGLFLSIRAGFIQVRFFTFMMKQTLGGLFTGKQRTSSENNISPFQAVSTALASTIGTGSMVGVATAITVGGPGAIFWMWISAFLGMMTKFSEIVLAVKFRETNDEGQYVGGPMYYLTNGLPIKWLGTILGILFAFFASVAALGTGNMTQANSISQAFNSVLGVDTKIMGVILAIIVACVVIGGIKSISRVTELVVPFMALFYIVFSLIILITHAGELPVALASIVKAAFSGESVVGGAAGVAVMMAVRMGFARGVFSNEAGLGSAPIAHAASSTKIPVEQGLWGMFEVFVTTMIICTMTALVILTGVDANGQFLWSSGQYDGAALTLKAFEVGLPGNIGSLVMTFALAMFALSTIFGWCYYGEKCIEFLFRKTKTGKKIAVIAYRILYVGIVYIGSIGGLKFVWGVSDTLNGCMSMPNLIGILLMSGLIIKEVKTYFAKSNR